MAHILGYESPEEVVNSFTDIGKQLYVDPAFPAEVTQTLQERGILQGLEFEAYRKDGEKIWLSLNLRVVRDEKGAEVFREGTIEDITERKRAEAKRLVIFEIIQGVSTSADLEALLKLVYQTIQKVVYAENCFVALYDEHTDMLGMQFFVDKYDSAPAPQKLGKSCAAHVFRTGESLLINKKLFDQLAEAGEVELVGEPSPAWLGVPLNTPAKTIGVLVVQHYEDDRAYSERDVEFLSSVGGQIAVAIERKQAEAALRESEERYRDLVENSLELITTHDLDGQILSANRAAAEVLGYDRKDHIGKTNLRKLLAPEVRDRFDEYLTRIRKDGVASGLMLVQTRTGERRIWEYYNTLRTEGVGTPIVRSMARDITERRKAEGRLAAQYVVTRALADSVTLAEAMPKILRALCETLGWARGALWTVDHKANVLRCHEVWHDPSVEMAQFETASRELTFAPGVGLPGRVWADGKPAWIPDVVQDKNFPRTPIAAKENLYGALAIPIEAGSRVLGVMEFFSKAIREPDPELLAMMATVSSQIGQFIERKRVEEALGESEEQLRQSQKLEAIGQLAGGVAHDFNNLLTVIGGYSSILLGKLPQDSPHRSSIEEIKKANDRASALTRQLLAFSRKQILQPKVLDLNTVVTDLEKMVRRLIGEDIDLLTITSPVLGRVKADPGQIEQVLLNLIVNARDAMPKGGKLTIETRNVVHSEEYAQRHAALPGPYVMLAVSDTGRGMDATTQPRVFEPFFTTKGSGKGTGLGLATVYGIVKQSGGNIRVYSEVGRGSTFKVYLPRVDEAVDGEEEVISRSVPQGTEMVLLVEDEDQVRSILKHILEGQGYQVLSASNGEEALSISQDLERDIKLMITDVVMPQMSGRELAERVLAVRPNLPVLFMSGYTDDAIVRHGLLEEKLNFMQKPFDSATVARKVREVLDSHL
jgi:PAS domain S-box-containing protein